MIAQHRTRSNLGIASGLLLSIAGRLLIASGENSAMWAVGILALLTGGGLFIWGCVEYALAKGRHPAWGLLGLASILGLVLLVVLQDRSNPRSRTEVPSPPVPTAGMRSEPK